MDVAAREAGLKPHIKCFAPRCSPRRSFAREGETCGCFFSSEFNGYRGVNVQAETATIAIKQVNHGRYDGMEQHVGYAGSLP